MFTILGAFINAYRGGQFGKNGKFINASTFGFCSALASGFQPAFAAQALMMRVGSSWGWGAYISAIAGRHTDLGKLTEQAFIDRMIRKYHSLEKQRKWGFYGLTIRGLVWGICLAIVPAVLGYYATAVSQVVAGASMGYIYRAVIAWGDRPHNDEGLVLDRTWALSEWAYGAVLWVSLDILALTVLLEALGII